MYRSHEYKIVGQRRDGRGLETLYVGDDWSVVSDEMPNTGDPDPDYSRVDLYRDGELVESAETVAVKRRNWFFGLF